MRRIISRLVRWWKQPDSIVDDLNRLAAILMDARKRDKLCLDNLTEYGKERPHGFYGPDGDSMRSVSGTGNVESPK